MTLTYRLVILALLSGTIYYLVRLLYLRPTLRSLSTQGYYSAQIPVALIAICTGVFMAFEALSILVPPPDIGLMFIVAMYGLVVLLVVCDFEMMASKAIKAHYRPNEMYD